MVLPSLERRRELLSSDDLGEPVGQLQYQKTSQLMKAVANLSKRIAEKRAKGKGGGTTDGN